MITASKAEVINEVVHTPTVRKPNSVLFKSLAYSIMESIIRLKSDLAAGMKFYQNLNKKINSARDSALNQGLNEDTLSNFQQIIAHIFNEPSASIAFGYLRYYFECYDYDTSICIEYGVMLLAIYFLKDFSQLCLEIINEQGIDWKKTLSKFSVNLLVTVNVVEDFKVAEVFGTKESALIDVWLYKDGEEFHSFFCDELSRVFENEANNEDEYFEGSGRNERFLGDWEEIVFEESGFEFVEFFGGMGWGEQRSKGDRWERDGENIEESQGIVEERVGEISIKDGVVEEKLEIIREEIEESKDKSEDIEENKEKPVEFEVKSEVIQVIVDENQEKYEDFGENKEKPEECKENEEILEEFEENNQNSEEFKVESEAVPIIIPENQENPKEFIENTEEIIEKIEVPSNEIKLFASNNGNLSNNETIEISKSEENKIPNIPEPTQTNFKQKYPENFDHQKEEFKDPPKPTKIPQSSSSHERKAIKSFSKSPEHKLKKIPKTITTHSPESHTERPTNSNQATTYTYSEFMKCKELIEDSFKLEKTEEEELRKLPNCENLMSPISEPQLWSILELMFRNKKFFNINYIKNLCTRIHIAFETSRLTSHERNKIIDTVISPRVSLVSTSNCIKLIMQLMKTFALRVLSFRQINN